MSQFLLPCACGAKIPVNRAQAGMTLPCPQCGNSIDVPTIRRLAQFASAAPLKRETKSARPIRWLGPIAAVALIVGLIGLAYGGTLAYERYSYIWQLTKSGVNLNATEADYMAEVKKAALKTAPSDTWDYWNIMIEDGLKDPNPPELFRFQRYLAARFPTMITALATGLVGMAVFFFSAVLMQRSRIKL